MAFLILPFPAGTVNRWRLRCGSVRFRALLDNPARHREPRQQHRHNTACRGIRSTSEALATEIKQRAVGTSQALLSPRQYCITHDHHRQVFVMMLLVGVMGIYGGMGITMLHRLHAQRAGGYPISTSSTARTVAQRRANNRDFKRGINHRRAAPRRPGPTMQGKRTDKEPMDS